MQSGYIESLIEKYNNGTATEEEKALVEAWYLKYNNTAADVPHAQLEEDQQESLDQLLREIKGVNKKPLWPVLTIAASLLIFFISGVFYLQQHKQKPVVAINVPVKNDAAPGGYKATITLANGNTIVLSNAKNGRLASQGNIIIKKTAEGKIVYANAADGAKVNSLVYNIAATQRGGLYQFVLSDGTKVWLNSASSIKYPVEFIGDERKVELTGEAYFEVAHNAAKPFRVVTGGQTVEVLGTHFNINAYDDEKAIKTTLLEGSVKVSAAGMSNVIKPGEQAQLKNGAISVQEADLDEAVAWKNGYFYFKDSNVQEVMKQLSRWYDVDVKYDGEVPSREFSGEISRNVNASQIFDILSFKKIHFKIEGKTLTVIP